jgi:hypothetical protein
MVFRKARTFDSSTKILKRCQVEKVTKYVPGARSNVQVSLHHLSG